MHKTGRTKRAKENEKQTKLCTLHSMYLGIRCIDDVYTTEHNLIKFVKEKENERTNQFDSFKLSQRTIIIVAKQCKKT